MKRTTAEKNPAALAKLKKMVDTIGVAMVVTVNPEGTLHARPMYTQTMRDEGELWFVTSDASEKIRDIAAERAVNVIYADIQADAYVSITGMATVLDDSAKVREFWGDRLARFFPQGPDDPHLKLLCVRIETAEYWDSATSRMNSVYGRAVGGDGEDKPKPGDDEETEHTQVDVRATPASG